MKTASGRCFTKRMFEQQRPVREICRRARVAPAQRRRTTPPRAGAPNPACPAHTHRCGHGRADIIPASTTLIGCKRYAPIPFLPPQLNLGGSIYEAKPQSQPIDPASSGRTTAFVIATRIPLTGNGYFSTTDGRCCFGVDRPFTKAGKERVIFDF